MFQNILRCNAGAVGQSSFSLRQSTPSTSPKRLLPSRQGHSGQGVGMVSDDCGVSAFQAPQFQTSGELKLPR